MIIVIVEAHLNQGYWVPRLAKFGVDPNHVKDHHFLFSNIGTDETPIVESLPTLDGIENRLSESSGLIVNLCSGCDDELDRVADRLLGLPSFPRVFVHASDKKGRFNNSFGQWTGDRRPKDYSHAIGNEYWSWIQEQLCLEVNPTAYEVFHDLSKRIVFLQIIIKSRNDDNLLAMWENLRDDVSAGGGGIDAWRKALSSEMNQAAESEIVADILGSSIDQFRFQSAQINRLVKNIFPNEKPAAISSAHVKELDESLKEWKQLAQQVEKK